MLIASLLVGTLLLGADFTAGPVVKVSEGHKFTEGPVWHPVHGLLYSDIPADTIYKEDKTVFRMPSHHSNGLAMDREGRLLVCEHGTARVTRTEADGSITVLAERFDGKRLNSPNDMAVRSDGAIFFTDPHYGLAGRESELGFRGVYLIGADGKLKLLAREMRAPNGIALSVDEKQLFVADSEERLIRVYDITPEDTLANGRKLRDSTGPDGIKVDKAGRIWATSVEGIDVIDPKSGELLQVIPVPEQPANCGFGGADGKTLYITARTGIYSVAVKE